MRRIRQAPPPICFGDVHHHLALRDGTSYRRPKESTEQDYLAADWGGSGQGSPPAQIAGPQRPHIAAIALSSSFLSFGLQLPPRHAPPRHALPPPVPEGARRTETKTEKSRFLANPVLENTS